jgi:hypothetical protein
LTEGLAEGYFFKNSGYARRGGNVGSLSKIYFEAEEVRESLEAGSEDSRKEFTDT